MLRFAFKPRHPITRVAFTADGREVITAQPFTGIAVRDRLTGEARVTMPTPKVAVFFSLAIEPEFGWVTAHTERGAEMFDPLTGQRVQPDQKGDASLPGEKFKQRWESTGSNLRVLCARNPSFLERSAVRGARVAVASNSRADLHISGSGRPYIRCPRTGYTIAALDSRVRLRHVITKRLISAFSPDGTALALGDGEILHVFDYSSREPVFCESEAQRPTIRPVFVLERPDPNKHGTHADKNAEHWLPPVAFDHAGRSLFTLGLRNRVQRIALTTGEVMAEWGWRCEPIRSLAVAPDDLTAAAGCQRGELVLWDLE